MPFTFAHPAIVVPFGAKKTKYLDFTALVIGTMAPDFEYFIYFKPRQIIGHTLLGQLSFNLPIAFIIAYIYHYILKESIITNLPKSYCNRYYYLTQSEWKINSVFKFIVFCYSMLIGAFTHIAWDSFTHKTGFFVDKLKLLSDYINLLGYEIPIYKILQHGSTLLGFVVIAIYLLMIQNKNMDIKNHVEISKINKVRFWVGTFLISIVIIPLMIIKLDNFILGGVIVTTINGAFIGVITMSIITKFLKLKN